MSVPECRFLDFNDTIYDQSVTFARAREGLLAKSHQVDVRERFVCGRRQSDMQYVVSEDGKLCVERIQRSFADLEEEDAASCLELQRVSSHDQGKHSSLASVMCGILDRCVAARHAAIITYGPQDGCLLMMEAPVAGGALCTLVAPNTSMSQMPIGAP